MSIELFMSLLTICTAISPLLTQALKKAFKELPSNIVALAGAIIVGAGGTISSYILMDIPFNAKNIICIILMSFCVWLGSMVGYDKIMQTIAQIRKG